MRNAVVTGAKGFIGAAVTEELLDRGVNVLALSHQEREEGRRLPEHANLRYVKVNLADWQQSVSLTELNLKGREAPDVFFHFAWSSSSGEARGDFRLQMENVSMTVNCLNLAACLGCGKFVCAGSLMEKEALAMADEPGRKPELGHVYSAAKLAAHHMVFPVADKLGIEPVWAIITNVYGSGERSSRFVQSTLKKMRAGESVDFTAADQWYDFLHVKDAAAAFYLLGEKGKGFTEYTVGSGNPQPLKAFIEEMHRETGMRSQLRFGAVDFQGIRLPKKIFETARLQSDTGFEPKIAFQSGIRETIARLAIDNCDEEEWITWQKFSSGR